MHFRVPSDEGVGLSDSEPVRLRLSAALAVAAACLLAACSHDGRTLAAAKPDQTASIVTTSTLDPNATFQLATPFGETTPIQEQYTCKGEDVSPPMSWVAVPTGTAELALVVTDSDADDFVHWVVAGMDPTIVTEIQEGAPPPERGPGPQRLRQARLGWAVPARGRDAPLRLHALLPRGAGEHREWHARQAGHRAHQGRRRGRDVGDLRLPVTVVS